MVFPPQNNKFTLAVIVLVSGNDFLKSFAEETSNRLLNNVEN